MARPQRLFLHSLGVELLPAGYQASRQTSDRRYGTAERFCRTHLARDADLCPHHRRHSTRDGSVPGRIPESNDRRSSLVADSVRDGDEAIANDLAAAVERALLPAAFEV